MADVCFIVVLFDIEILLLRVPSLLAVDMLA